MQLNRNALNGSPVNGGGKLYSVAASALSTAVTYCTKRISLTKLVVSTAIGACVRAAQYVMANIRQVTVVAAKVRTTIVSYRNRTTIVTR